QTAVKLILDIISRLQSKVSLKGVVKWSFDNDEIPLRKKIDRFKWEQIAQSKLRLDYLSIIVQATDTSFELADFVFGFIARKEPKFPDHFSFEIMERF